MYKNPSLDIHAVTAPILLCALMNTAR